MRRRVLPPSHSRRPMTKLILCFLTVALTLQLSPGQVRRIGDPGAEPGVYTDQIPIYSGEEWAVASDDDSMVVIYVFQDSTSTFFEYLYDTAANSTTLLAQAPSSPTPTGHKVLGPDNTWHHYDRVLDPLGQPDYLLLDGSPRNWTYVEATKRRKLRTLLCLGGCYAFSCGACCGCCFCVHNCTGQQYWNPSCCQGRCN